MMLTTKLKCAIEVTIFAVYGIQNSVESEVYVKWVRGKNSIETKRQQGNRSKLVKFTDKFKLNSSLLLDSDGRFKTDLNSLTVFCDGKEIGVVRFDLSKHYGKKQEMKQATISSLPNQNLDDIDHPVLESDQAHVYPNSYLQFRVRCDEFIPASPVPTRQTESNQT